jgi:hypothetical protein|tara:strand:- start:652 stop:1215 length:564 start_codon:yes stop_codon:yes gene_type:complete
MKTYLKLTFEGIHQYTFNGIINNESVEDEILINEQLSLLGIEKVQLVPEKQFDFPYNLFLFGINVKSSRGTTWSLTTGIDSVINSTNFSLELNNTNLKIYGSLILKVSLKDDFYNDLLVGIEEKKVWIDEFKIKRIESHMKQLSCSFTFSGDWGKDREIIKMINENPKNNDRVLNLEFSKRLPKEWK